MILRKIGEAEAILEPYFDGGESDQRFNELKGSLLTHYTVQSTAPALTNVRQGWSSITVFFDGIGKNGTVVTMQRDAKPLDLSEFDTLRLCAAVPASVKVELMVKSEGAWLSAGTFPGDNTTEEHELPLPCKVLEGIGYRLELLENKPAEVNLQWLGVCHLAREAESQKKLESRFDPDWEDYMKPHGDFVPQVGIWFGADEVEALRKKVHGELLGKYYQKLLKKAEAYLTFEPEKEIGRHVANTDRRWCRTRDMKRTNTAGLMGLLAFTGLMEQREDLTRMAVRMALSAAHCEYWCDSLMGSLVGCSWHHRSFTEETYCRGCALVLDWAGDFLTPYGRTCLEDAIAMKALPRLESDYRRMEYIRHMNQGIVFNWGRLTGLLAMEHTYPRYDIRIREAEEELKEMLHTYVLPDGGTMEGPSYWGYTFSQALPQLFLFARWHKLDFETYSDDFIVKTGEHALSLLSIGGMGDITLPLNDAHGSALPPLALAALARLSGNPIYSQLLATSFTGEGVEPTVEMMILMPESLPEPAPLRHVGLRVLPDLGQTRLVREDKALGDVELFYTGGPAYFGHYHMDKGAFILETNREVYAMDRGVTNYSHPETGMLQLAGYHNLAYPEKPDGSILRQLPDDNDGTGAKLISAVCENGIFRLEGDITGAWEPGYVVLDKRYITSPAPDTYLIEDEIDLTQPMAVSFRLNTALPGTADSTGAVVQGKYARMEVRPVDWTPEEATYEQKGIDGHEKPVNLIRLVHSAATHHRFTTRVTLVPEKNG